VRSIDEAAIASAAAGRFRSEYDYAVFEYLRSAKVIQALERSGARLGGRVLDAGCGGGGTALSLAEESAFAVGLDLEARFRDAGTRLAAERTVTRVAFVQGDGGRLPFKGESFDLVLSHSVIEHVSSAEGYLGECHRVLRRGGVLYLSTAPFLSLAGAFLARRAPWALREKKEANTFVALAEQGREKEDDLKQRVTVRRLSEWIRRAGFRALREERHVTGFFRRALPGPLRRWMEDTPWAQDVMIGHIQCVLEKP